jgi:hypothetical protein
MVFARDGEADRVDCGAGRDTAQLDLVDVIVDATADNPNGGCETVTRATQRAGEDADENRFESPREDADQGADDVPAGAGG